MKSAFIFLPSSLRMSHPGDKIYKLSRMLTLNNIYDVYDGLVSHWSNSFEVVIGSKKRTDKLNKDFDFFRHKRRATLEGLFG